MKYLILLNNIFLFSFKIIIFTSSNNLSIMINPSLQYNKIFKYNKKK